MGVSEDPAEKYALRGNRFWFGKGAWKNIVWPPDFIASSIGIAEDMVRRYVECQRYRGLGQSCVELE